MTGKEALTMAANIMHESDLTPYLATAKTWINLVLGELYEIANRRRAWRGEEEFYDLPLIEDLEDDLPYDDELNVRALVKGLVARMFSEECDNALLAMYRQEYELAARELDRAQVRIVTEGGSAHESFAAFGI